MYSNKILSMRRIKYVLTNLMLYLTLSHFWNFLVRCIIKQGFAHNTWNAKDEIFVIFPFIKDLCTWEWIKIELEGTSSVLPISKSHISTESEALIDDATGKSDMHCIEIEIFLFPV